MLSSALIAIKLREFWIFSNLSKIRVIPYSQRLKSFTIANFVNHANFRAESSDCSGYFRLKFYTLPSGVFTFSYFDGENFRLFFHTFDLRFPFVKSHRAVLRELSTVSQFRISESCPRNGNFFLFSPRGSRFRPGGSKVWQKNGQPARVAMGGGNVMKSVSGRNGVTHKTRNGASNP